MATIREWVIRLLGTLRPARGDAEIEEELRLPLPWVSLKATTFFRAWLRSVRLSTRSSA
jgi:hypothetical protein